MTGWVGREDRNITFINDIVLRHIWRNRKSTLLGRGENLILPAGTTK